MTAFDNSFDRHVKLTIYCEKNGVKSIIPLESYQPEGKNIRITFEVNYYPDQSGKTAPAYIRIYNLSETNNELICDNQTKVSVKLEVGYKYNVKTIYEGDINTKFANFEETDVVTNMWGFGFDGTLPKWTKTFSFPPKGNELYSWSDMINTFCQQNHVIFAIPSDIEDKFKMKNFKSMSFTGLSNFLDALSKDLNVKYFITKEDYINIYFSSLNEDSIGITSETKVLSRENGLLNDPNVTGAGLEIKTLLNPDLKPFDSVLIKSEYAKLSVGSSANFTDALKRIGARFEDSSYKNFYSKSFILYLTHRGDTFSDVWESQIRTLISNEEM